MKGRRNHHILLLDMEGSRSYFLFHSFHGEPESHIATTLICFGTGFRHDKYFRVAWEEHRWGMNIMENDTTEWGKENSCTKAYSTDRIGVKDRATMESIKRSKLQYCVPFLL